MVLDIILISVVVLSLAGVIFIVVRKVPQLRVLDVETVPATQVNRVRERILLERMKRQTAKSKELIKKGTVPVANFVKIFFQNIWKKCLELERFYQKESDKNKPPCAKDLSVKLAHLLEQAENCVKTENLNEAEKTYIDIISFDAKNINAYRGLAEIYSRKKEYKEALETRQFILKILQKGKRGRAEENKTAERVAEIAEAIFDIGVVYSQMENFIEAKENFGKALELEPNNPKYLDQMIQINIMLRDKNSGEEMLSRLSAVNPENQKLKEYQNKIEQI
ncbi:tetratricopeptide repeat protein [Candidatus Falkowbacteria bacterium]|nr:tetratricopeptide repeat protein [Candidatus Falkowbacteria bacterium]